MDVKDRGKDPVKDHMEKLSERLEAWKAAAAAHKALAVRPPVTLAFMRFSRDPYAVLGVSPRASEVQIRAAYNARIAGISDHPGTEELLRAAVRAAHILLVPEQRRLYDRGDIDIDGRLTASGRSRLRRQAWRRATHYYFVLPFCTGLSLATGLLYATAQLAGGPHPETVALLKQELPGTSAVSPVETPAKFAYVGRGREFLLSADSTAGAKAASGAPSAHAAPVALAREQTK